MSDTHIAVVQPNSVPVTSRKVRISSDTHSVVVKNPDSLIVRKKHGKVSVATPSDTTPPPQDISVVVKNMSMT
jgi:hypothetical protein